MVPGPAGGRRDQLQHHRRLAPARPLDLGRLRGSLATVVARHAALRTSFPDRGGIPAATLRDRVPVDLPVQRCADEPAAIQAALYAEAHHRFDLAAGPLFRFRLLQLGPQAHVLIVNVRHIIFDGWSHGILMTELAACYGAGQGHRAEDCPSSPRSIPMSPPGSAAGSAATGWPGSWTTGDRPWPGRRPRLSCPRPGRGPRRRGTPAASTTSCWPPGPTTPPGRWPGIPTRPCSWYLLAGFAALLNRCTGQDDIVIGTPVAGRLLPETEHLIGCFFNTLALRARFVPGMTFRDLTEAVRETAYAAYDHQEAPFEKVIEAVGVTRQLDQQPLAQVMFVFQNVPHRPLRLGGLTATVLTMPEPAKLDLILTMAEEDGHLAGLWEYNAALFDAPTIAGLTESLTTLLSAVLAAPDRPLCAQPVLSPAQQHQARQAAAGPASTRLPATLPELFTARAAATPAAPAVITHDGQVIDFASLDARSARVASWLYRQGVRRGDTVGVCLDPDAGLPVALLGVLRAGAAYVPIDPATPPARAAELRADAAVRLVITQSQLTAALTGGPGPATPRPAITPDDLAYVLFTSGSTGRPKGVAVTHRNVTAYLRWFAANYQLGPADRTLGYIRYSFDLSVPELYAPLITGGALVLADPPRRADPRHLTDVARAAGVTVIAATPSVLRLLADDGGLARCQALRLLFTCGEPLPADLVTTVAGETRARLDNQYGPTETTVAVTAWPSGNRAPATSIAPLGQPVDDCQVYLNDASGQPVPPGAVGKLQVGGEQVARGYAARRA